jgi:hypothetical protein
MEPRAADTEQLLTALERHRQARGSVELYDALLEEHAERLQLALGKVPLHPLRPELIRWLLSRGHRLPELPSPAELALAELEERLEVQQKQITALREQVETLQGLGLHSHRVNEAYAAVVVLFVGIAVLGWAAAFGLLPFHPEDPTSMVVPTTQTAPARPGGTP